MRTSVPYSWCIRLRVRHVADVGWNRCRAGFRFSLPPWFGDIFNPPSCIGRIEGDTLQALCTACHTNPPQPGFPHMSPQHSSRIGTCPRCHSEITGFNILIKYESSDGQKAVWAECPACQEVVDPV